MESKRSLIFQWIEQEKITGNAEDVMSAMGVIPNAKRWRIFLGNLFLWLGGLALSFAVMFFIAYNWDAMGRFTKFALVEVSIVLCMFAYWKLDINKVAAKVSITSATILLGVLLAFYGQTYQTGADPWQLFFYWALLMLPWALVAQFASIWLIWVVLLNLSIVLYFHARGGLFGLLFSSTDHVFWVMFIFNSLAWLIWEFTATKFTWLGERWPVWLLAVASGFSVTFLMLTAIFDHQGSIFLTMLSYFSWLGILYFVFRRVVPDLFILAGFCLSLIVVATSFFANLLLARHDSIVGFFVLTIMVIAMANGAAKWLKHIQKEMLS